MVVPILAGAGLALKYGFSAGMGYLSYKQRRDKGQSREQALTGAGIEAAAGALVFPGLSAVGNLAKGAYYARNTAALVKTAKTFDAAAKASKAGRVAISNPGLRSRAIGFAGSAAKGTARFGRDAAIASVASGAAGSGYDMLTGISSPYQQNEYFNVPPGYEQYKTPDQPYKAPGVSSNYVFAGTAGVALAIGASAVNKRIGKGAVIPGRTFNVPRPSLNSQPAKEAARKTGEAAKRAGAPAVDVAVRGLQVAAEVKNLQNAVVPKRGSARPEAVPGIVKEIARRGTYLKSSMDTLRQAIKDPNFQPKVQQPTDLGQRALIRPQGKGGKIPAYNSTVNPAIIREVPIKTGPTPPKPSGYPESVSPRSAAYRNKKSLPDFDEGQVIRRGQLEIDAGKFDPETKSGVNASRNPSTKDAFKEFKAFLDAVDARRNLRTTPVEVIPPVKQPKAIGPAPIRTIDVTATKVSGSPTPKAPAPKAPASPVSKASSPPVSKTPAPSFPVSKAPAPKVPATPRPVPSAGVQRNLRALAIERAADRATGPGIPPESLKAMQVDQVRRARMTPGPLTPVFGPQIPEPRPSSPRPLTIGQRVQDVLDRFAGRSTPQGMGNRPSIDPKILAEDTRRQIASGQKVRAITQMASEGIRPDATYVPGSTGQTWVGSLGPKAPTPVTPAPVAPTPRPPAPSRLGPISPPPTGPKPNFEPRGKKVTVPSTEKRISQAAAKRAEASRLAERIRNYQAQSANTGPRTTVPVNPAPAKPVPVKPAPSSPVNNPLGQILSRFIGNPFGRNVPPGITYSKGNGPAPSGIIPPSRALVVSGPRSLRPPILSTPPAISTGRPVLMTAPPAISTGPSRLNTVIMGPSGRSPVSIKGSATVQSRQMTSPLQGPQPPQVQGPRRFMIDTQTAPKVEVFSQRMPDGQVPLRPSGQVQGRNVRRPRANRGQAPQTPSGKGPSGSGPSGFGPSGSGGQPPKPPGNRPLASSGGQSPGGRRLGSFGSQTPKPTGWQIKIPDIKVPKIGGRGALLIAGGTALAGLGLLIRSNLPQQGQPISTQAGPGPFGKTLNDWFGTKGDNDIERENKLVRQAMQNQGNLQRAQVTAGATTQAARDRLAASNPQAWQALYGSQPGQPREVYGPRRPGEPIQFVQRSGSLAGIEAVSTQNQRIRDQAAADRKLMEQRLKEGIAQAQTRGITYKADQELKGTRYTQDQTTQRQRIISGANITVQNDKGRTERYKADQVFRGVNAQANATVRRQQVQTQGLVQIAGYQEGTKRYQADRTLQGVQVRTAGEIRREALQQSGLNFRTDLQQRTARYQSDNTLRGTIFETQGKERIAKTEAGAKRYVSDNELKGTVVTAKANEYAANQEMFGQVASAQAQAAGLANAKLVEADPERSLITTLEEMENYKRRKRMEADSKRYQEGEMLAAKLYQMFRG